jgi:xanthine/CO dehydrogenase XdhC/CoxF family maturation factor
VKQWLETRQVLDRLAELLSEGRHAALATVVRVRGSAYRHEGAKMLVADDGSTVGNVSGGCLEADVREVAMQVLATNAPQRREYCAGSDEVSAWDLGVGCEGSVDVWVASAQAAVRSAQDFATTVSALRGHLDGSEPFAWCTDVATQRWLVVTSRSSTGSLGSPAIDKTVAVHARDALDTGKSGLREFDGREVFVDVFTPPPTLLIVSGGDDARPLAKFAGDVGFRVVVADRRAGLLTPSRFPARARLVEADPSQLAERVAIDDDTFAVVMNHNYADDREYVRALLATAAPYIGMLGPRQRTDRILAELSATGPIDDSRVYGPVGLDIGTDGAEQVGMSVIAEVLAVRSGRRPASLRERRAPIHAAVTD